LPNQRGAEARASADRPAGKLPQIVGYAAVFNQDTVLVETDTVKIIERIAPGAFDNALREGQDVRALFNHNADLLLGRTAAGTLRLSADHHGLAYVCDPPDSAIGRNVVASIARGDASQSSFEFKVRGPNGQKIVRSDVGGKRVIHRTLIDLNLVDVSPVTYPAYRGASVSLRSGRPAASRPPSARKLEMEARAKRLRESLARFPG
jgi:HK97 family phage prohead protease